MRVVGFMVSSSGVGVDDEESTAERGRPAIVRWYYDPGGASTLQLVTPDEVGRYAESLPQVKRKGTEARPAWYVHDRLVVRLQDPSTLVIRVPLSEP